MNKSTYINNIIKDAKERGIKSISLGDTVYSIDEFDQEEVKQPDLVDGYDLVGNALEAAHGLHKAGAITDDQLHTYEALCAPNCDGQLHEDEIDYSDSPPLDDSFFKRATVEMPADAEEYADKFDDYKPRMDLIPGLAEMGVAEVLTYGANTKYGAHNWRKGLKFSRLYAATRRHLNAFMLGEDCCQESGLSHVDHAIADLMMLSEFIKEDRKELDDRK